MKELEVKAMLADNERIPDEYKIGGRLSSEFLDGVDYAEQRIMESGTEVWLARDPDGWLCIFNNKPLFNIACNAWLSIGGFTCCIHFRHNFFPELTLKNSPVKARIILED
jgi:hypothetical protein